MVAGDHGGHEGVDRSQRSASGQSTLVTGGSVRDGTTQWQLQQRPPTATTAAAVAVSKYRMVHNARRHHTMIVKGGAEVARSDASEAIASEVHPSKQTWSKNNSANERRAEKLHETIPQPMVSKTRRMSQTARPTHTNTRMLDSDARMVSH